MQQHLNLIGTLLGIIITIFSVIFWIIIRKMEERLDKRYVMKIECESNHTLVSQIHNSIKQDVNDIKNKLDKIMDFLLNCKFSKKK